MMKYQIWISPVGRLHLVANEEALLALAFDQNWKTLKQKFPNLEKSENKILAQTILELEEYFGGKRRSFSVPLVLDGTPFQKRAWTALSTIPFGKTATYGEQALRIRKPSAVRAVGRANGLNRISILIPCHRVIGSNGSLTGYAGGIKAKQVLLTLEGALAK